MEKKKINQAIINGGEELTAHLLTGEKEVVKVKMLKISQFEDYLRVVDNEPAVAELLCGKDPGWSDTLTPSSVLDIVEAGHSINFTSVYRWAQRRANVNEALMPVAQKAQKMGVALSTSAPTPHS